MISPAASRRSSQKATCPSCGGEMTVPAGDLETRVCCPHCRRTVVPQSGETPVAAPKTRKPRAPAAPPEMPVEGTDGLTMQRLLEEILEECRQRRDLLEQVGRELRTLETRAAVVRQWLENATGKDDVPDEQRRALIFHCQLFERLSPLEKGAVLLQSSRPPEDHSLGAVLRETFEAVGWRVEFEEVELREDRSANVTLTVAPGPLSHAAASVWFALSQTGLHLRSLIDPGHQDDQIRLQVHGWHVPMPAAS